MKTESRKLTKPVRGTRSCSAWSPRRRRGLPPTIDLTNPRFVFLPFFNTRLRAMIDGELTWYHHEDVMNQPDLEKASRSIHRRQRLVRRIIAKWTPFRFPTRVTKFTVISEADFFRLMYASKRITGGLPLDLEEDPITDKLAQPGGDFEAPELEFFRMELSNRQADWRQDKTGSPPMDEWNKYA